MARLGGRSSCRAAQPHPHTPLPALARTPCQVFVAVFQLGVRPAPAWLDVMAQTLAGRQGSGDPGLKSAASWLQALRVGA